MGAPAPGASLLRTVNLVTNQLLLHRGHRMSPVALQDIPLRPTATMFSMMTASTTRNLRVLLRRAPWPPLRRGPNPCGPVDQFPVLVHLIQDLLPRPRAAPMDRTSIHITVAAAGTVTTSNMLMALQ
jgi:hypothetical protein